MEYEYSLQTEKQGFYNITSAIQSSVIKSGVKNGICVVFNPHTTSGITINENCDPDVVTDLLYALDKTFPKRDEFKHAEGNTTAHLKASVMGSSVTVIIRNGRLVLGTWQGIYFTEFDGPRIRSYYVKIISD